MENLDTSIPKKRYDYDTSASEMFNIEEPKRLSRWQRRNIKFRRNLWKQRNRRLKG